jgi:hypothetical protein
MRADDIQQQSTTKNRRELNPQTHKQSQAPCPPYSCDFISDIIQARRGKAADKYLIRSARTTSGKAGEADDVVVHQPRRTLSASLRQQLANLSEPPPPTRFPSTSPLQRPPCLYCFKRMLRQWGNEKDRGKNVLLQLPYGPCWSVTWETNKTTTGINTTSTKKQSPQKSSPQPKSERPTHHTAHHAREKPDRYPKNKTDIAQILMLSSNGQGHD